MSLSVNPQLLLSCLERFENQAHNVINDDQSIELFCREVIPFLEKNPTINALRQHWKENYTYLNQQVEKTSAQALIETTETYQELKKTLLNSDDPSINQKIASIDRQFKEDEKSLGPPLHRVLYDELKGFLQLLLVSGYEDLCKKYAKLITRQVYIQKDPQQTDRWVRVLDDGKMSHFLSKKEIQTAKKQRESILSVPPEHELTEIHLNFILRNFMKESMQMALQLLNSLKTFLIRLVQAQKSQSLFTNGKRRLSILIA